MTTTTAILLKHLTVKSKSGFEWLCLCPYHEDTSPSFSINIRKKLFICYACGAKGNMNQLLEHLGITESCVEEEMSLDELAEKVRGIGEDVSRTERPPVGVPIPARIYSDTSAIHKYWNEERKLGNFAIQAYKLGYDPLSDEAIIPVNDFNGHNIGMIRRTFDPSRPRYLYSKGMKTSEVVFGAHEAMKYAEKHKERNGVLVITEGSVDAMSVYHQNAHTGDKESFFVGVAILGSRISKTQALIIKKMGFQEIVIATDMDRAGRVASVQVQTMLKDVKCGALVSIASWEEAKGKDLNSLKLLSERDMMEPIVQARNKHKLVSTPQFQNWNPYAKYIKSNTSNTIGNAMVRVNVNGSWHHWSYGMFGTVPSHEMIEVTQFGDTTRSFIWNKS